MVRVRRPTLVVRDNHENVGAVDDDDEVRRDAPAITATRHSLSSLSFSSPSASQPPTTSVPTVLSALHANVSSSSSLFRISERSLSSPVVVITAFSVRDVVLALASLIIVPKGGSRVPSLALSEKEQSTSSFNPLL